MLIDNTDNPYIRLAYHYLAECEEHLEVAKLINEHLEVFYDQKLKPSEESEAGWA